MRSIVLHLAGTTREELGNHLSRFAETINDAEWCFPSRSSPVLYVGFYNDFEVEATWEELDLLKNALGQMPTISVIVDVSGRVSGTVEAQQIADFILKRFRGVACDDYTSHCWTLSEIQAATKVGGLFSLITMAGTTRNARPKRYSDRHP